jgi:dTDP-4-dehydrorhamnose 3,5-epimerase
MALPTGVTIHELTPHADDRGVFTELYRVSWRLGIEPVQWNAVCSRENVLRGVHAHWRHEDYLTLVSGSATIGFYDLRPRSETEGHATTITLAANTPRAITLPPGVAHGFFFHEPSIHVYSVSHDWDMADELGCRWDDPALGISWPCSDPVLSERDRGLGSLAELTTAWLEARDGQRSSAS